MLFRPWIFGLLLFLWVIPVNADKISLSGRIRLKSSPPKHASIHLAVADSDRVLEDDISIFGPRLDQKTYANSGFGIKAIGIWDSHTSNDGRPDLLYTGTEIIQLNGGALAESSVISWRDNQGTGEFDFPNTYSVYQASGNIASFDSSIVVKDLNGDGRPDFVVSSEDKEPQGSSNNIYVFFTERNGLNYVRLSTSYKVSELRVRDVNGDRVDDIVVLENQFDPRGPDEQKIGVFLNNGNKTFRKVEFDLPSDYLVKSHALAVAEINGDGRPDLVLVQLNYGGGFKSNFRFHLNDGFGGFRPEYDWSFPVLSSSLIVNRIAAADLNNDGFDEIVAEWTSVSAYFPSELIVLPNDLSQFVRYYSFPVAGSNWSQLDAIDVDVDGDADILITAPSVRRVTVLKNSLAQNGNPIPQGESIALNADSRYDTLSFVGSPTSASPFDPYAISGAQVDLTTDSGARIAYSTYTDGLGAFSFKNIPPGSYTIRASHSSLIFSGYEGQSLEINADSNDVSFLAEEPSYTEDIDNTSHPTDSDGDGVSDSTEALHATDHQDPGSYPVLLDRTVYTLWNSFLGMTNILELINRGDSNLKVSLRIFSIAGKELDKLEIKIAPGKQQDIILNDLPNFITDSYGIVKIDSTGGNLEGGLTYYRADQNQPGDFEFVFGVPLSNPNYGISAVGFNTIQPSMNHSKKETAVANWLSIVNLGGSSKGFRLKKYDHLGSLLSSDTIKIEGFGRRDIDGGHVNPGPQQLGAIIISPLDDKSPYLAQLMRYGENGVGGYDFAFPLIARAGSGRTLSAPISNKRGASNWVELLNTSAEQIEVAVSLYSADGILIRREDINLAPFAQKHLPASNVLKADSSGHVEVRSSRKNSLIANSIFYFINQHGSLVSVYSSQARESLGDTLNSSYNLFLEMENALSITNTDSKALELNLKIDTANRLLRRTINLSAKSSIELPLHQYEFYGTTANSSGTISLEGERQNAFIAEIVRSRVSLHTESLDFVTPIVAR